MRSVRYAFAGDRDVAVAVLDYLLEEGDRPLALLIPDGARATHADALLRKASVPEEFVARGDSFRSAEWQERLRSLDLDYIVAVHFPYIVPEPVLAIPREGVLNLHPAYLPYNRGWHTPSWAILEGTPVGGTLHFMDAGVDSGDIVHQRQVTVSEADTAHSLYTRLKVAELTVFREAWPSLRSRTYSRTPQPEGGTSHRRSELLKDEVRRIDLDAHCTARELLRRLRGLTTSAPSEAAFFEHNGRRYRIRVQMECEDH
jgi:methionyl-tRNA formyltransferase